MTDLTDGDNPQYYEFKKRKADIAESPGYDFCSHLLVDMGFAQGDIDDLDYYFVAYHYVNSDPPTELEEDIKTLEHMTEYSHWGENEWSWVFIWHRTPTWDSLIVSKQLISKQG